MDEQGGTLLTITDEEGNEYVLEHLDTIEMDGRFFLAFLPADMDPEDEEYGMVLMEAFPGEGDEEYLEPLEGEEAEEIYNIFAERIYSGEGEEDEEE